MRLERTLIWAIACMSAAAPMLIASAHPWTQVALSAAAFSIALGYGYLHRKRGIRVVPVAAVAAAAVIYTIVQVIPLPSSLLGVLSPSALALRGEVAASRPSFAPITLDLPATLLEVTKALTYLGLLLAVGGLVRSVRRARRVLVVLACTGAAIALLSIGQRALGVSKILGFYQVESQPGSGIFGTFVNGNHAASFFGLTALIAIGLAIEFRERTRLAMCAVAATAVVALLSTASRSGAVGFAVGGFALAAALLSRRFGRLRGVFGAGLIAVLASSATLWAADGLRSRLAPNDVGELWANQKVRGWHDGLKVARTYAWTGVGRGSFEAPVMAQRTDDEGVRLVYPENLAVQLLSEWGFPIVIALLALMVLASRQIVPWLGKLEAGTVGAACGVLAVLVHDFADFSLEMAGVAIPAVVALGVVVGRCEEKSSSKREQRARVPFPAFGFALAVWGLFLGGAVWAAPRTLAADWQRCKDAVAAKVPGADALIAAAIARHPAADHFELLAAHEAIRRNDGSAMRRINRALTLHPANAQAHHLAARLLVRTGHVSQAALEYRLASELGAVVSSVELLRIIGDHLVDAVPQTPKELLAVAHFAAQRGRVTLADRASARAVERAGNVEQVLAERVAVAVESRDPKLMRTTARDLIDATPSADAYIVAARTFAQLGDRAAAEDAMRDGMKAHPGDGALVLFAARQRMEAGDLTGARVLLGRKSDGSFTLADRRAAETLVAEIADRAGDVEMAIMARARARLLTKKLESSP